MGCRQVIKEGIEQSAREEEVKPRLGQWEWGTGKVGRSICTGRL